MGVIKKFCLLILLLAGLFYLPGQVGAVSFDLVGPTGQLKRGDNVQFTINIDTEGELITTTQVGITYQPQYLKYTDTTSGDAMTSVIATSQGEDKFLLDGTNSSGFNGQGVFAIMNFQLIADAPGSGLLCILWGPPSVTPVPTSPPNQPTSPPQPTSLPKSGHIVQMVTTGSIGLGFLSLATLTHLFTSNPAYKKHHKKNKK